MNKYKPGLRKIIIINEFKDYISIIYLLKIMKNFSIYIYIIFKIN